VLATVQTERGVRERKEEEEEEKSFKA